MNAAPTNRDLAAVARRAADIIQERGKAVGIHEDDSGRVCAHFALSLAREGLGYGNSNTPSVITMRCRAFQPLALVTWNDLPTTTAADIAKVFLRVADDLEVAP